MESIGTARPVLPGKFISLEGPDGAGKTYQAHALADRIKELGWDVTLTREPGGTDVGERVRAILMAAGTDHDPITDALLFNAARRQLVADVIEPALAASAVVVCDRYADSTLAYQGYGAGAPRALLRTIGEASTRGLVPRRTVLLDVPVEVGLQRRFDEGAELTRFETEAAFDRAFHERVRAGFLELAAWEPERWRVVAATGTLEDVAKDVWAAVADLFEAREGAEEGETA